MIKFGPSGNSETFYEQGNKHSYQAPAWLRQMGLDAYEYSFGRGVRMKQDTAARLREAAEQSGIAMSVHAPYYINLANMDDEKIEGSIRYLVQSAEAAGWMGAGRIVFHPGAEGEDRQRSMARITEVLPAAIEAVHAANPDVTLCPETMGKIAQVGDLDETIEFCRLNESLLPCIDFGHLHARSLGRVQGRDEFAAVLDAMERGLGRERIKHFHIHFSRIEYTPKGEKKHWTYADTQFGPDFDPLAELLHERGLEPVVISESRGTMAEDAATYKRIYEAISKENDNANDDKQD